MPKPTLVEPPAVTIRPSACKAIPAPEKSGLIVVPLLSNVAEMPLVPKVVSKLPSALKRAIKSVLLLAKVTGS